MKLAVVGTGYVGLVAGTCLSETGHDVVCIDIDAARIALLEQGQIPIYEPGLEELVRRNAKAERLTFSTDPDAVRGAEVIFVAVQTPQDEDGSADLTHMLEAVRDILGRCRDDAILVLKSTVPVGSADRVWELVHELRGPDTKVEVASNPEFLKEGAAVDDFQRPDRVVIGHRTERTRQVMGDLYAPFVRTENPILFMDHRSAELTKYASNAMLATRISFMNGVALLCEATGADVDLVRKAVGADSRIGYPFLFPGVGYGGSCFPKDVQALLHTSKVHGVELPILQAAEDVNVRMRLLLLRKAKQHFGELKGRKVAVWGLAFKPKTDDVREAPALYLIRALVEAGAKVEAFDPAGTVNAKRALADLGEAVTYHERNYDCLEGAEALFLMTEWNAFRRPDFERIRSLMATPVVFDGRNIYNRERLLEQGFVYHGVGR
ncbi:MAG: UDP-glucose/GDP-mannose dehydrogenase family protein [Deltaproteobacteria bacterium]|nr:UDP-glucose/GDP-mannose dehydrogenase family protein [Deltaproteobacteria bacterium]